MRLVVVVGQKLNRMRGHHRQLELGRELHGGGNVAFIIQTLGALQFQVKTRWKQVGKMQRTFHGARVVALHQRLADSAALRTRQRNQSCIQLLQPFKLDDRLVAHHVFSPGAGDEFTQVEIALAILHQQQQARCRRTGILARRFEPDIGTDQRLDADFAPFLVKLDRAKQVAQVGNGQRGLLVGGGGFNNLIDAVGAVND